MTILSKLFHNCKQWMPKAAYNVPCSIVAYEFLRNWCRLMWGLLQYCEFIRSSHASITLSLPLNKQLRHVQNAGLVSLVSLCIIFMQVHSAIKTHGSTHMTCVSSLKGCISPDEKCRDLSMAIVCSNVKRGKLKWTPAQRADHTRMTYGIALSCVKVVGVAISKNIIESLNGKTCQPFDLWTWFFHIP